MTVTGDIPYLFVPRLAGLQLLQVPGRHGGERVHDRGAASRGARAAATSIQTRLRRLGLRAPLPDAHPGGDRREGVDRRRSTRTRSPRPSDRSFAGGYGALSVHEVAIDPNPRPRLAYVSYYAGGFRVLEYGPKGLKEVGAFVEQDGSDFWGVEVHRVAGKQYVLASDRDYGLYIFQYQPAKKRG